VETAPVRVECAGESLSAATGWKCRKFGAKVFSVNRPNSPPLQAADRIKNDAPDVSPVEGFAGTGKVMVRFLIYNAKSAHR
jgi:hypothetical protein